MLLISRQDFEFYKEKTKKKHVLFGRKAANSSYRDLGDRTNMVVSTKEDYNPFAGLTFPNLSSAIEYASERNVKELFIAGGISMYHQTLSIADRLYITRFNDPAIYKGDKFPDINYDQWNVIEEETRYDEGIKTDVTFTLYERKS
jgi:dihydrofolate reductase